MPPSAPAPALGPRPERLAFSTTDPDEAQGFIAQMYRAAPPRAQRLEHGSPVSISQVSAGGLSHVDFTMPPDLTLHLAGTDDLSVTTLLVGRTQADLSGDVQRFVAGDSFLGSFPGSDYVVRCLDFRASILTVPGAALAEAAGAVSGRPAQPVRFATLRPVSSAGAERWRRAAAFARDLLDDDDAAASSPLILGSAARVLAATALAVFPNSTMAGPEGADGRAAHPATLVRVLDHIDEHAHEDIGVADLAAAANVTARAVQVAFRRHLDCTPTQHLRRVRLERAHRDLLVADPSRETVTTVAYRWGFASPSRFAAYYREAYGVLPSTTLHR